jgi:hypothetical protein
MVVFPAPLGPSNPKISPARASKLTSFTASRSPNRRLTLTTFNTRSSYHGAAARRGLPASL